jgi:hypothetical protein
MSDQSDFPGLYPDNYKTNPRAARIVSDLISLNYLPDPLPDGLPKEWLNENSLTNLCRLLKPPRKVVIGIYLTKLVPSEARSLP